MTSERVAIVTGSNKGIGFAIVKGLCEKFDGIVYLTARNIELGEAAVQKLKKLGHSPFFHQLDITDESSIEEFKSYLKEKYGGIDVLVNNAAIAFTGDTTEPFNLKAKETIRVNYYGTLSVCEALFPLLRENARVVNVSSMAGHLSFLNSDALKQKFKNEKLAIPELNELMDKFVQDSAAGKHKEEGWGEMAYAVSKVGVTALTFIQQRLFDAEDPNRNISVNSVHPGYVDTDMSSHQGPLTIEEGARAPLFLALESNYKGKYVWSDTTLVEWDGPLPAPV